MSAHFEDGKDEGALRTIGEVSKALKIKTHVLRYWEQQFPMLEPLKRSGGRRYYRSEDVELIETIDRLVNHEGYTLKGAKKAIKDGAVSGTAATASTGNETAEDTVIASADASTPASPAVSGGAASAFVSSPDQSIADDGGVGDFFGLSGKEPAAPLTVELERDEGLSRAEILARLKRLRAELAQALAA